MITNFKNLSYLKDFKYYQYLSFIKLTKLLGFFLRTKFDYKKKIDLKFQFINLQNFETLDHDFCINFENRKFKIINNWLGGKSLLANFNVHYFNFIHKLSNKNFDKVLDNWLLNKNHHKYVSNHPYVISRRIINCLIYVQNNHIIDSNKIFNIIEDDYNNLIFNLEFRLGNNHLTSNLMAIYFVINLYGKYRYKYFFNKIFENHIISQILTDGCHIEQTPMYHHLFLQDLIHINEINDKFDKSNLLFSAVAKVNEFNLKLNPGLDECTFFNDSNNYQFINSEKLNFFVRKRFNLSDSYLNTKFIKKKSGFFFHNINDKNFIFFNSNIITKFNPGHIHSGLLPYEVFKNKKKIITNLGIDTYKENKKRFFQRSDLSKNTSYLGSLSFGIYKSFRIFYFPNILKNKIYSKNNIFYISYTYKFGLVKKIIFKKSILINNNSINLFEISNINHFKSYFNSNQILNIKKGVKIRLNKYKFVKFLDFGIKTNIIRHKFITNNSKSFY